MEYRICRTCKKELSIENFYKVKPVKPTHSWRYSAECRGCRRVRSNQHYSDNTSRHNATVRLWYKEHGRFKKYGLTAETYAAMLERQGGCCALCKNDKPGGKGIWHIDHIGGTNNRVFNQCGAEGVRGLLCHRCNVSLGHYEKLLSRIGQYGVLTYLQLKE